ncbi:MAG: hydrogenase maturation protease [Betaproteobacteria bacterium]
MIPFEHGLREILSQPTCIVGVGNLMRNDDAVGVMIADRLGQDLPALNGASVVLAEDVIENHVFRIAEGDARNVLVIDAVEADAEAGSVVLGKLEDLEKVANNGFSTHKLALSTAGSILKHYGKDVYLLGIVAANTDYGTEVSQEILDSAETVIDLVRANSKE